MSRVRFYLTILQSNNRNADETEETMMPRRSRRELAVWGEPAPDYHQVQLNDYVHFLKALIFVDSKIVRYLENQQKQSISV